MPDPRDVPNSYRAQEDDGRKRSSLLNALQTIRLSRATLAEVEPQIATYERWHTHLVTWRQTLLTTLEATPANDARTYGLELSIRRIDVGLNLQDEAYPAHLPLDTLMHEAGYIPRDAITRANGEAWYGTLPTPSNG